MKKYITLYFVASLIFSFYSCEKDNMDGPNATFAGELRDKKTGELIPQESSDGSRIYYIELGWDNPPVQNVIVKSDGTFKNSMMFSGNYQVILDKGNYAALDTMEIKIKPGNNYKVFEVTPHLRILEQSITKTPDGFVKAKFKLEQVTSPKVSRIGLFAHSHIDVSGKLNDVNNIVTLDRHINKNGEEFELTIDLKANSSKLVPGKSYYFRIGAQSHANESKYNYGKSVKIDID